jgi:hypothetical protein
LVFRTIDTLNRAIGDLDTVVDKQKYLECYASIFTITKQIKFEPRKGDEVSTVNAQVLIRDEMQSRFIQMQSRLAGLKTENDEVCFFFIYQQSSSREKITNLNTYGHVFSTEGNARFCVSKHVLIYIYFLPEGRDDAVCAPLNNRKTINIYISI